MKPRVEQLGLPKGYGNPKKLLRWDDVEKQLVESRVYWLGTTRPDGRPHVVPVDGLWLDGAWYYGGGPETVHMRNVLTNENVAMHIGDGMAAVIVEGPVRREVPSRETAERLAEAQNSKYAEYGMDARAETYLQGVNALRPRRIIAWTSLPVDATRFVFDD